MNNDIIQSMGLIAEEAYNTYAPDAPLEKLPQYTVLAASDMPSGFQGYLLLNNSPTAGEPKYVFAFRGTEPGQWYKDLIIADFAYMGTGTAPQQMKDAMAFVQNQMALRPEEINSNNTVFTGHSLGGSLAGMASYIYGFDAYTYNGFGIQNMLWDVNDTYLTDNPNELVTIEGETIDGHQTLGEYLEDLAISICAEDNRTTNIVQVGYSHPGWGRTKLTN